MCSTRPLLPRRVMGGPEALSAPGPFWLHQRTCVGPDGTSALGHNRKSNRLCLVAQDEALQSTVSHVRTVLSQGGVARSMPLLCLTTGRGWPPRGHGGN
jgi:hypothetical protein